MKNNNFLSRPLSFASLFSKLSSKSISLFSILIFIFFGLTLSSCEKEPEPIGIGLEDEQLVNTYYTDTTTINVKLFQLDSINTTSRTGNSRLLVGSLADQYVGRYSAQGFGVISLTSLTEDLVNDAGQTAVFDSLVAFFQTDYAYGDTLAQNNIQLYSIAETFNIKNYYQFDTLRTETTIVGMATYPNALDTNKVLRVPLSEELGRTLFNYGVTNKFANDSLFRLFSKGLAIRSGSPNTSIIGINPLAPATNLTLYYHYPNDTIASSYKFAMLFSFSNIKNDLSNSVLSPLATQDFISSETTDNIAVLQAGTGIAVKLEFPYLQDFVTTQSVVIQRAELDIPVVESAMSGTFTAPNQLLFLFGAGNGFYYSPSGTIQFLQSESANSGLSMGYSIIGKSYSYASITGYINQMAQGKLSQTDGLILQPSENNIAVNRLIFPTQKNINNLPAIRLRMYYSIAK